MTNEITGPFARLNILSSKNIEDPTFDGLIIFSSNGQLLNYRRQFSGEFMRRGGTYSENQKTWSFRSGARITFGIVKNQGDSNKFQGLHFTVIEYRGNIDPTERWLIETRRS